MLIALSPAPWSSESWGLRSACRICSFLLFHKPSQTAVPDSPWLVVLLCLQLILLPLEWSIFLKEAGWQASQKHPPLSAASQIKDWGPSWAANSESLQTCHPQGKVEDKSLPASPNRSQTVLSFTTSGSGKYITSIFHPTLIVQLSFSSKKSVSGAELLLAAGLTHQFLGRIVHTPSEKAPCVTDKFGFVKTNTEYKLNLSVSVSKCQTLPVAPEDWCEDAFMAFLSGVAWIDKMRSPY